MKTTTCIAGSIVAFGLCAFGHAETDTAPTIFFNLSVAGQETAWTDAFGIAEEDSSLWHYQGTHWSNGGNVEYALYADPDPVLGFDFSVENNTGVTSQFILTATMLVPAWNLGSVIGASVGASVTDANFDGNALLSSVGFNPLFEGKIDGNTWLPLFNNLSVGVAFPGGTSVVSDVDGLPGPNNPGPANVLTEVSISLTFDLTAGDRASFTGVFIVEYVPAPAGALAFLGLGVLGRRRRD